MLDRLNSKGETHDRLERLHVLKNCCIRLMIYLNQT